MLRRRDLTRGESEILRMIQQGYGLENTSDGVSFTDADEAVIFVESSDGTCPLMVNLTNLATWRVDGTIPTDEELKRDWLRL